MAKKKPVWVDQEAHGILKKYSKLIKSSMVSVASEMVLDQLDELSADAGLETGKAPSNEESPSTRQTAKASDKSTPSGEEDASATADAPPRDDQPEAVTANKPSKRRKVPRKNDGDTQFLGGVWQV